jgi:fructose-specific component phosphotransferase system IIB-like protein
MQRKFMVFSVAAALLLNALGAAAQEPGHRVVAPPEEEEIFIAQGPGAPLPPLPPQVEIHGDNLIFMATEMSFSGKLVKGAPYSAQAVTEAVQALSDGNRIVRKNTAQLYRDTEGRTRREQTVGFFGPFAASGEEMQTVFINDPVAGVNYILEPSTKTARKLPRMELRFKVEEGAAAGERQKAVQEAQRKIEIERTFTRVAPGPDVLGGASVTVIATPSADGATFERHSSKHEAKTEKLEARSFDGVTAEGSRTTVTIPAGEIGNEQPIQIVDERWYSPELQAVVMTRHSDPRYGETTYRLTNISRTEPAAALFQVPSDYTVKDASVPTTGIRRMRRPAAPLAPPQEN